MIVFLISNKTNVSAHHQTKRKSKEHSILPFTPSPESNALKKKINYDISHIAFRPLLKKENPEQSKTFPSLHLKLASLVLEADTEETATYSFTGRWNRDFKGRIYSDHFIIYSREELGIGMTTNSNSPPHWGSF